MLWRDGNDGKYRMGASRLSELALGSADRAVGLFDGRHDVHGVCPAGVRRNVLDLKVGKAAGEVKVAADDPTVLVVIRVQPDRDGLGWEAPVAL